MLCYTISPLLGWLQMPLLKRAMFSPARVAARFQAEYSTGMALRPSQIRATSIDGALMIPSAITVSRDYGRLTLPVVIIAGDGDKIGFKRRSEQLRDSIPGSVLQIVEGVGHMVHNLAMASASRLKSSMTLNRRTHVLRADLRCGDIGAAVLGSLADRSGIEFVYQLCSYLPLIGLLTALLPNIESTAHTQVG